MKNKWWIIIFIYVCAASLAEARTIRIAVIDTGLNNVNNLIPICEDSKDVTLDSPATTTSTTLIPAPPFNNDIHGHGTNISNIIHTIAKGSDYCQVIVKTFQTHVMSDNLALSIKALHYLNSLKTPVDIVNYSAGGFNSSFEEAIEINNLTSKGVIFIAAAGNEKTNLDSTCNYYPACYDDTIVVVGNVDKNGNKHEESSYGKRINMWANGVGILGGSKVMTGTSQATAIISGQMVVTFNKTYNKSTREVQGGEADVLPKSAEAFYIQTGLRSYSEEYYKKKIGKEFRGVVEQLVPLSQMVIQKKFVIEKSF